MISEEIKKKRSKLEEQYNQDKKEIDRKEKQMTEEIELFKKESNQLLEKVLYLTKDDLWDKRSYYRKMEESQAAIQTESRKFYQSIKEKRTENKKKYMREIQKLEEADATSE